MNAHEYIRNIAVAEFNGELDPAKAYAELYSIIKTAEEAIGSVKDNAVTAIKQYGKEGFTDQGYNFTPMNGAGKWKYDNVQVLTKLSERIKKVQSLAQVASKTGAAIFDQEEGELIEPAVYIAGSETIKGIKDV